MKKTIKSNALHTLFASLLLISLVVTPLHKVALANASESTETENTIVEEQAGETENSGENSADEETINPEEQSPEASNSGAEPDEGESNVDTEPAEAENENVFEQSAKDEPNAVASNPPESNETPDIHAQEEEQMLAEITPDEDLAKIVAFEDATLKKFIAEQLDITGDITVGDLLGLTKLTISDEEIFSLEGIERATNLTKLQIDWAEITDIQPLAQLTNLTELHLNGNIIKNIQPLENLTNLTKLELQWNEIETIDALAKLVNLTHLDIENNQITDISALTALKNLRYLNISGNKINDLSIIAKFTQLEELFAYDMNFSDLTPLENLTNLTSLDLYNNNITDISTLAGLTKLTSLFLSKNKITDLSVIQNLTNLEHLYLSHNNITTIPDLTKLGNLKELWLHKNKITDISEVTKLETLEILYLSANEISNFSEIVNLTNLRILNIDQNEITTLPDLSALTKLEELGLFDNAITNLTAVGNLKNLKEIELSYNPLTDISILTELPMLETVILFGVERTSSMMNTIRTLQKQGVTVFFGDEPDVWAYEYGNYIFILEDVKPKESIYISAAFLKDLLDWETEEFFIQREGIELAIPLSIFNNDADVEVIVEKVAPETGSLSETFIFTIKQGEKIISQFTDPIQLTFDVDMAKVKKSSNLFAFYFNEQTGKWDKIGGQYENGKVIAETDHFSKFTVFEVNDATKTTTEVVNVEDNDGKKLPNTATNTYNLLLVGTIIFAVGVLVLFIRTRKMKVK